MKTLLIVGLVLVVSVSQAAVLRVASDGTQPYAVVQDAINAASAGDTILIMAGSYPGFTVDRKLVLIGTGTGIGVGEGVLVIGPVWVSAAADSSELRSLWIRTAAFHASVDSLTAVLRIQSGATRVFVWRCFLESNTTGSYTSAAWVGVNASADFVQCTLWPGSVDGNSTAHYGLLQKAGSNVTVRSCVIANAQVAFYRFGTNAGATLTVQHCIATCYAVGQIPFYTEASGVVENSAFMGQAGYTQTYVNAPNMIYNYCAYTISSPPGITHIATTTAAFVNMILYNARDSDFRLAAGSNLIDAGNPGSPNDLDNSLADIGVYGGQHPYVDGGVPDYPFAVQVEVPYSAPLNGTMRIWGRGRVGPGY